MDRYITGAAIRRLREERKLTQEQLAAKLFVSGKTVSKWETGQGLPDITLLEPLAKALGISVIELFSGDEVRNRNRASKLDRLCFYVCPVCGNVVTAHGEAVVSCCGVTLPPCAPEEPDAEHTIEAKRQDGELHVRVQHPMTREHHISFLAAVSDHSVQLVKLYPEGAAEAHFRLDSLKQVYAYCNRHGLYRVKG